MQTNLAENVYDEESKMTLEQFLRFRDKSKYRWEFINGVPRMMASPTTIHDFFVSEFARVAGNYLFDKPCRYYGNCDVKLFANISDIVIPDSLILCDMSKEDGQIIYGDPDLVLEVWSPGNSECEIEDKIKMYKAAGVKEIWEVYPGKREIVVWYFDEITNRYKDLRYNLFDAVESRIFLGLIIDYSLVKSKLDWSKSKY